MPVGAPVGNHNAKKGKIVEGAIKRALARDDWKRLNDGVERLVEAFASGEPWALQMVADRCDGKPEQAITGPDGDSIFAPLLIQSEAIRAKLRLVHVAQGDTSDKTSAPKAA